MGFLDKAFYHTGKASAQRPCTSILIGLLITAIGTIGFVNFRSTVSKYFFQKSKPARSDKLWLSFVDLRCHDILRR